ncbi:hypothetical protein [Prescottella equi]
MPTTLRRALRYVALTLAAVLTAGVLYTMFIYHSISIFTPPERLESLGRTYLLSNSQSYAREEIHQPTHAEYTLEHVSNLWPRHPIYQFQNNEIQGQATTSAYLKWGNRYIKYSLSGGP